LASHPPRKKALLSGPGTPTELKGRPHTTSRIKASTWEAPFLALMALLRSAVAPTGTPLLVMTRLPTAASAWARELAKRSLRRYARAVLVRDQRRCLVSGCQNTWFVAVREASHFNRWLY
jgi:hypothetical protein